MDHLAFCESTQQFLSPSQTVRHRMALADDASQPLSVRRAAYLWLLYDSNLQLVDNETLALYEAWISQPHELDALSSWEN